MFNLWLSKDNEKAIKELIACGVPLAAIDRVFSSIDINNNAGIVYSLDVLGERLFIGSENLLYSSNESDEVSLVREFLNQKGKSLLVLAELFNVIPDEVYFNSVSFGEDETIIFTGTTDTKSRVFSLVTEIERTEVFKDVKVDFTKSRRVKGKEVADFGLSLILE